MSTSISVSGGNRNSPLLQLLMADEVEPGSDLLSYQLAKLIYLFHPLGAKMTDGPISMAQSQPRLITVQNAPVEVVEQYSECWEQREVDGAIHNGAGLSRTYGLSSLVLGCKQQPPGKPLDMDKIHEQDIYFNVLDPLNTAGSLVLNQVPTASDFAKPVRVTTNGESFHSSRFQVLMNESPIYIAYTNSAFGFVGRSVYQRALFPLKSFINTMVVDDFITTKNGLLIAKQAAPGSFIDGISAAVSAIKRMMFKQAHTGQVASIGVEESIEALNMQNVDGAGTFARNNILKNIATAADMPAKLLENETMVLGFGEGTEDAKNIAAYIDGIRKKLKRIYRWFDNIVMYLAWTPEFFSRMQALYPEQYRGREYREVFSEWRRNFKAEWPSVLREPESELVKVAAVKFEAIIAVLQTIMPHLNPENMGIAIQWLCDSLSEEKRLFPHELVLDIDGLVATAEQDKANAQASFEGGESDGVANKMGRFDSAQPPQPVLMANLRRALDQLPARARPAARAQ